MNFKELIIKREKEVNSKLILALDIVDEKEKLVNKAVNIIYLTCKSLVGVKLNQHLLLPLSLEDVSKIIEFSRKKRLITIADLKLSDISSTNMVACNYLWKIGFDCVIMSPLSGYEGGVGEVINNAHKLGKGVILLGFMSNKGAKEFFKIKVNQKPLFEIFLIKAREWNVDGVIVGATNPNAIKRAREIIGKDLLIFSPGVGIQGGSARDAISAGSDFIIVGRSIINSKNPSVLAERIRQEALFPS